MLEKCLKQEEEGNRKIEEKDRERKEEHWGREEGKGIPVERRLEKRIDNAEEGSEEKIKEQTFRGNRKEKQGEHSKNELREKEECNVGVKKQGGEGELQGKEIEKQIERRLQIEVIEKRQKEVNGKTSGGERKGTDKGRERVIGYIERNTEDRTVEKKAGDGQVGVSVSDSTSIDVIDRTMLDRRLKQMEGVNNKVEDRDRSKRQAHRKKGRGELEVRERGGNLEGKQVIGRRVSEEVMHQDSKRKEGTQKANVEVTAYERKTQQPVQTSKGRRKVEQGRVRVRDIGDEEEGREDMRENMEPLGEEECRQLAGRTGWGNREEKDEDRESRRRNSAKEGIEIRAEEKKRKRGGYETEKREGVELRGSDREKEVEERENIGNNIVEKDTVEERKIGGETGSEISSIDLIDARMLNRCLQLSINKQREEREKSLSKSQGSSNRGDSEKVKKKIVGEVEKRRSNSTTSSIAALFVEEHLEREGKRVGKKNITRRKVWMRWRGIIRGEIRRSNKKKEKIERIVAREEEDKKLLFDYTTQGLSIEEVKLLGRGEVFCVVDYKMDEDRNKVDIYQFQRRLRLHEVFRDPGIGEEGNEEGMRTPSRQTFIGRGEGRGRRSSIGRRGGRETVVSIGRGSRCSRVSIRGRVEASSMNRRESIVIEEAERSKEKEGRRLPSIYDPDSKNRNLNRYNTCIQEEIMLSMEDKTVQFRDNITKEERKALKQLKDRIEAKEIIITRADKGSGLVAVDYGRYINKGTKYIEEEARAYTRVQEEESSIIGRLTKERNKIAEQLKEEGVIAVHTATYIKKQLEEKITGIKFYYKIHKDTNIDSMPLRPLQSCIKAPMQHLSIVLTDILQPLLTDSNIPSFIFDTNQLLYRLHNLGRIPRNCTLISSDVSALYPSIPHTEGFRAMRLFLEEHTKYSNQQIDSIIRALELVITTNYMTWNKQIYKQVNGVAMGTPVAVAYANIFMNWVDKKVRQLAPYIYEHIRFIDDNLFILPVDRVEQVMGIANNVLPPHIKFTYEKLDNSTGKGLPFLDTQLFILEDSSIESRLYTKKTDRHTYLLPSSYHPPHITQNIPLAVFGRIRKICSREEWFVKDAKKTEGWLETRGYDKKDIQKALLKTSQRDRWGMIEQIEKNRNKNLRKEEGEKVDIPLIMTYNQHTSKIRKILKDRQPLLDSAFRRTRIRPRLSYRRRRNLNDIIVQKGLRGPIEENRKELNVFSKCGERPGYRSRCPCKGKHRQDECRCCIHSRGEIEGVECNCNSNR